MAQPRKGSPFEGISGTKAPARNTKIPNLTAQVTLAKTRKAALTHGGLLTPEQQKAASEAGKALAAHKKVKQAATTPKRTPQSVSKPLAGKPLGVSTPSKALPLPSSAPFVVPLPSAPASVSPLVPSSGRRGAQSPRLQAQAAQPKQGSLLGGITHAASVGLGTGVETALSIPSTLLTPIRPGATSTAAETVKPTTLGKASADVAKASTRLAANVAKVGVSGGIPHNFSIPSIDLVAPAGAATTKGAITADELKALEAQGYDLKPRLRARFTKNALKNGWNPAELDGISGSALIDKAFTHPAALPLRVLANTASGIARLGTLPAGVEGAVRETAAGHGLKVAQALGEGLYSELPVVGKHKTSDTAVADPFGFLTQFAGAGKTVGTVAGLGRAGNVARVVEAAGSGGLKIERGNLPKNAYDATRALASDKLASSVPRFGDRLQSQNIDNIVRFQVNKHADPWWQVQRPYKKALDKVGEKRAAELLGNQMAGGKPEQIAAFYRTQGNSDNAKFFDDVAAKTKTLTPEDHAFLEAHKAVAEKTTQSSTKFGPTAAEFRRYSPLIRSSAHLGDPEAQRILALRDEYLKGFNVMPPEDVQALRGAIDQGVQDYAAKHLATGGTEPSYVEYSQPRPFISPPYKPGPGGPTGFKKQRGRQKVETGATFESGKYLIDPKAPLIESIRAQRVHLADILHEDVSKAVGQHVTGGDHIPDGHVFVSETNLRGLKKTTNDLEDNPVSQPAYDEFAHQKQSIFDRLSGAAVPSTERVPRGEKGYVLPIASWKRILDHTRPPSRTAYDRFMGQYQRVLIGYRPSTFFNNAFGSPPLAATFNAGPMSWAKATEATRDPSLAASYVSGHGVAGGLAPNPRSTVGAGFDWARHQSAKAEDFSRKAAYFAKVLPGHKKRAKELGYKTPNDYLRDVATGKVDADRLNAGLDNAEKALGDALKPNGKFGRAAGRTILFHNWVGHMAKMILHTLPVDHPRRLAILNELSAYGDQYRQEHGVWPDWYAAYLPLFQHVERIGRAGVPQTFTKAYSTSGVNPFATLNNFAAPVSTNESAANIILGLANPVLSTAGKTLFARPYDSKSPGRFLAGQVVRQIPGVSVVRPQGGMASDSIPFISEQRKKYTGKHPGSTLPFDFRPGARAEPGVLGALERYLFGGVYDVPAQGPIHNIEQGKHIGAVARAARKH